MSYYKIKKINNCQLIKINKKNNYKFKKLKIKFPKVKNKFQKFKNKKFKKIEKKMLKKKFFMKMMIQTYKNL